MSLTFFESVPGTSFSRLTGSRTMRWSCSARSGSIPIASPISVVVGSRPSFFSSALYAR